MQTEIKRRLQNVFMRGFREGASGAKPSGDLSDPVLASSAYGRGYRMGQDAAVLAEHSAERYATATVEGAAVAQARANAGELFLFGDDPIDPDHDPNTPPEPEVPQ